MTGTPAAARYFELATQFWLSRTIWVAAHLKLADALAGQPQTAKELAFRLTLHAPSLTRVLKAMAAHGFLTLDDNGRYALTELGEPLRSDHPQSQRAFVDSVIGGFHYNGWTRIADTVRTGKCAFELKFGEPAFDWLSRHEEDAALFGQAMSATTAVFEDAIMAAHDFGAFSHVVDVGGSHGSLVTRLLQSRPEAEGLIFDLPDVIEAGRPAWSAGPVAGRISGIGGSCFDSVPTGGDLYVLKFILHDWSDEESIRILRNVRKAMAANGRVTVVDMVLPDAPVPHIGWMMDMNMLAMTTGRERSPSEFDRLFAESGFRRSRLTETPAGIGVVEAEPA